MLRVLFAVAVLLSWSDARAAWPERAVTLVVPFAAGDSPDVFARLLAERLSASWAQPVTIQNVPGGSSTLGVDRVAKAAPDGYTLGLTGDGPIVVRVSMDPPPPYDPRRDLTPVSLLVRTRNILVVRPELDVRSLPELVALAKSKPGELAYGHSGVGFSTHLGMEMLKQAAGIDIVAVPFTSEADIYAGLAQGRIQMRVGSGPGVLQRARAGEVRPIAVTSRDRAPALPNVPTIAEGGYAGFEAVAWFGLIAPAGTPPDILRKVRDDAVAALAAPPLSDRIEDFALVKVGSTPEEFASLIPAEIARMQTVLQPLGLRAR